MNAKKAKMLKSICVKTNLSYEKIKKIYKSGTAEQRRLLSLAIKDTLANGKDISSAPNYENTAMKESDVITK